MATLLADYAAAVKYGLMNCVVTNGLPELRNMTPQARWCIVSGGDEAELQAVFSRRSLTPYFDAGIFGSPTDKTAILEREFELGNIRNPALYLGDSRLDHQVASAFGIDFVFVSQWTEFSGWQDYCAEYGIPVIDKPAALSSLSDITPGRFT